MNARMVGTRVAVVGGSLGGLTAALILHDTGCDVVDLDLNPLHISVPAVEENESQHSSLLLANRKGMRFMKCSVTPEPTTAAPGICNAFMAESATSRCTNAPMSHWRARGAGIVLNPATVRYFNRNDALDVGEISTSTRWLRYMDRDGGVADQQPFNYRFTSYNALYRGLLACFDENRYHLDQKVVEFDQDADGVTVRFASDRTERCDLLVCADGIRSTARGLLLPDVAPTYAGYVGWRGTVGEAALTPETFAALNEAITYYVMPNSHALFYPIPGTDGSLEPGSRLTNWLWYRNVAEGPEHGDLMTDREGELHEVALGQGAVQERHVEELRYAATSALPPPLAEVVLKTAEPFVQVVFDLEVSRMTFGRVCLIGDAAFALRPHAAAGSAKAAEDAWKLGEAVQETGGDVNAALEAWEPGQLELGRQILARTRDAGQRAQFEGAWQVGEPLPFGLYEVGDNSML